MNIRFWRCALVVASAGWLLAAPAVAGEIRLTVEPGDLWKSVQNGTVVAMAPEERREFTVPGTLFAAPLTIEPAADPARATVEQALGDGYDANRAGDAARLAATFVAAERAEVLEFFADAEMLKQNSDLFRRLTDYRLEGTIDHAGLTLAIVAYDIPDHDPSRMVIPLAQEGGGYYTTNALSADDRFGEILAAIRKGQFAAAP